MPGIAKRAERAKHRCRGHLFADVLHVLQRLAPRTDVLHVLQRLARCGAHIDTFEGSKTFFGHAHMVFPPQFAELARIRCYCFAPDTLAEVAQDLGLVALRKPYRSP